MRKFAHKVVAINDRGHAIGEDHPRAVLTNHEVQLLLELRGEGYSYAWLAGKFEVGKSTVYDICSGRKRGQYPSHFKPQRRRER